MLVLRNKNSKYIFCLVLGQKKSALKGLTQCNQKAKELPSLGSSRALLLLIDTGAGIAENFLNILLDRGIYAKICPQTWSCLPDLQKWIGKCQSQRTENIFTLWISLSGQKQWLGWPPISSMFHSFLVICGTYTRTPSIHTHIQYPYTNTQHYAIFENTLLKLRRESIRPRKSLPINPFKLIDRQEYSQVWAENPNKPVQYGSYRWHYGTWYKAM